MSEKSNLQAINDIYATHSGVADAEVDPEEQGLAELDADVDTSESEPGSEPEPEGDEVPEDADPDDLTDEELEAQLIAGGTAWVNADASRVEVRG